MGMRFRKSINLGGVRINLSKSGLGFSAGTKGFRVTKMANDRTRTTASIPGTGVSYVKETSFAKNKAAKIDAKENTAKQKNKHPILKKVLIVIVAFIVLSAISSCISNKDEKLESITLSSIPNSMDINQTESIEMKTDPEEFDMSDCILKSDISNIAQLSFKDGALYIETISEGTTNVWIENDGITSNKLKVNVVDVEKAEREAQEKAEQEAAQQEVEETQEMVWISGTGTKYHSNPNCSNMKNPVQISKDEAIASGLEPCKRCY